MTAIEGLSETSSEATPITSEREVRTLFQQLVARGVYSFRAAVTDQGVTYPDLITAFPTLDRDQTERLLAKLRDAGILEAKLLDKVTICPKCGSTKSSLKYNCPRCSSYDVGKVTIIEHTRCGYIGSQDSFRKGGEIVCPKCKGELKDVDFRKIGTSFECQSCGSRFEAPTTSNRCANCDTIFTYKDGKYVSVYLYSLTDAAKRALVKDSSQLESFLRYLQTRGFEVSRDKELAGRSGTSHRFDIVASRGLITLVADLAFEPLEDQIVGLFAKKFDAGPTATLFFTIMHATGDQERISSVYGIRIISLSDSEEVASFEEELDLTVGAAGKKQDVKTAEASPVTSEIENKEASPALQDSSKIYFEDEEPDLLEL